MSCVQQKMFSDCNVILTTTETTKTNQNSSSPSPFPPTYTPQIPPSSTVALFTYIYKYTPHTHTHDIFHYQKPILSRNRNNNLCDFFSLIIQPYHLSQHNTHTYTLIQIHIRTKPSDMRTIRRTVRPVSIVTLVARSSAKIRRQSPPYTTGKRSVLLLSSICPLPHIPCIKYIHSTHTHASYHHTPHQRSAAQSAHIRVHSVHTTAHISFGCEWLLSVYVRVYVIVRPSASVCVCVCPNT